MALAAREMLTIYTNANIGLRVAHLRLAAVVDACNLHKVQMLNAALMRVCCVFCWFV